MHNFYIPVMGTGFTIDTPLKVAPFGIHSVVSLVDDKLIEQVFGYYQKKENSEFEPISKKEHKNWRYLRILRYLNFLQEKVTHVFNELKSQKLVPESRLYKFFNALPDGELRDLFFKTIAISDPKEKDEFTQELLSQMKVGRIDVNIMTKLNRVNYFNNEPLGKEEQDALSALRAYAHSDLDHSAVIFSAGMNPQLYSYLQEFSDFYPDENGRLKKEVILKVSDYRSALIQGKFLAKKGIWISEFRIESGLNCGGHAFATDGILTGPTLQEFFDKKSELKEQLYSLYLNQCQKLKKNSLKKEKAQIRMTYQGGLAHPQEAELLKQVYQIDQTGWGSPFLLCPDVTNVDEKHLQLLEKASLIDIELSESSPLNIPFWQLKNSDSEKERLSKIERGKPGSVCPKGYLVSDTEFREKPLCTASLSFQNKKLNQLNLVLEVTNEKEEIQKLKDHQDRLLKKACICHDLAGSASLNMGFEESVTPSVCCGPNLAYFHQRSHFYQMIEHINHRDSDVKIDPKRSHFFINEIQLYIDYYNHFLKDKPHQKNNSYLENLLTGIEYYIQNISQFEKFMSALEKKHFLNELSFCANQVRELHSPNVLVKDNVNISLSSST